MQISAPCRFSRLARTLTLILVRYSGGWNKNSSSPLQFMTVQWLHVFIPSMPLSTEEVEDCSYGSRKQDGTNGGKDDPFFLLHNGTCWWWPWKGMKTMFWIRPTAWNKVECSEFPHGLSEYWSSFIWYSELALWNEPGNSQDVPRNSQEFGFGNSEEWS